MSLGQFAADTVPNGGLVLAGTWFDFPFQSFAQQRLIVCSDLNPLEGICIFFHLHSIMAEGGGAAAPTFSFGLGVPTPSVDEASGADDTYVEQDVEVRPGWLTSSVSTKSLRFPVRVLSTPVSTNVSW